MLLENAEKRIKEQEEIISGLEKQLDGGSTPTLTHSSTISIVETPKLENIVEKPVTQQPPVNKEKKGQTSLTILKQQVKITNLTEEIQDLKIANKDLESEVTSKNSEILEV